MKQQWLKLLAAIDARTLRERLLIMGASIAMIIVVADTAYMSPARKAQQNDLRRSTAIQQEMAQLDLQLAEIQAQGRIDPNLETRARITAMEQELAAQKLRLAGAVEQFITPSEMNRVLHALVSSTSGLTLHGLRSLPAESLIKPAETDSTQTDHTSETAPTVWKRGAEIELSGDYNALLAYLRAIEAMPWRLNWDALTIESDHEGDSMPRFVLRLHTLSLSEDWIGAY